MQNGFFKYNNKLKTNVILDIGKNYPYQFSYIC